MAAQRLPFGSNWAPLASGTLELSFPPQTIIMLGVMTAV
jgi:hypothetical protein